MNATGASGATAQTVSAVPSLASLPVYVRAGTILPRQPLVQSTADKPQGPLSLEIYPGDDCHGVLYADDGHTLGYQRGGYLRQELRCSASADELKIRFEARSGDFHPWCGHSCRSTSTGGAALRARPSPGARSPRTRTPGIRS